MIGILDPSTMVQGKVCVDDFQDRVYTAELYYCSDFSSSLSTSKP